MKSLLLVLAIFSSAVYADANSTFVDDTLTKGQQILSIKDETDRTTQMCALLRQRIGKDDISALWLGTYAGLSRDQVSINAFIEMVPEIMMSKIMPLLGSGGTGVIIEVDPNSTSRGNDVYEVGVTVKTNGRVYSGKAVLKNTGGVLTVIDAEYNGYSAVDYQGREYQKFLDREYNKDINNSLPVTALVQDIVNQEDYVHCP